MNNISNEFVLKVKNLQIFSTAHFKKMADAYRKNAAGSEGLVNMACNYRHLFSFCTGSIAVTTDNAQSVAQRIACIQGQTKGQASWTAAQGTNFYVVL
jgi:hypothetical protein